MQIDRYDLGGKPLASFSIALPAAYSSCQLVRIDGYDSERIPYVFAQYARDAPAKCILMAPRKDAPFVYAVGNDRPWIECSEFSSSGVSRTQPQRFVVLR